MLTVTTPGPAAVVTVRLCGAEDAVLEIHGAFDDQSCDRARILLRAVLEAGAKRVIVDVAAAPEVGVLLQDVVAAVRAELRRRGGWLLVEGPIEDTADPTSLVEAFDAYRRTIPLLVGSTG